jgi:hypothetical protein
MSSRLPKQKEDVEDWSNSFKTLVNSRRNYVEVRKTLFDLVLVILVYADEFMNTRIFECVAERDGPHLGGTKKIKGLR